jgi:hypothetical protein
MIASPSDGNPFIRTRPLTRDDEERELLRITPEMVSLASILTVRDWGIDSEAHHQWRLEEDWECARQNPEPEPVVVEGTRKSLAQIEAIARVEIVHEDSQL